MLLHCLISYIHAALIIKINNEVVFLTSGNDHIVNGGGISADLEGMSTKDPVADFVTGSDTPLNYLIWYYSRLITFLF
jgi:hypothetical protein